MNIKNLRADCTRLDIRVHFMQFGPVAKVWLKARNNYGFVVFSDKWSALRADASKSNVILGQEGGGAGVVGTRTTRGCSWGVCWTT